MAVVAIDGKCIHGFAICFDENFDGLCGYICTYCLVVCVCLFGYYVESLGFNVCENVKENLSIIF